MNTDKLQYLTDPNAAAAIRELASEVEALRKEVQKLKAAVAAKKRGGKQS